MRIVLICLIFITTNLSGQVSPKEKTAGELVGTWKFKPFYHRIDGERALLEEYLIMEMSFSSERHFKFVFFDSMIQEGKWDISENGKSLLLSERRQIPPNPEELLPVSFPVKTKKGKYIKIIFQLTIKTEEKEDGTEDIEIEFTPVK